MELTLTYIIITAVTDNAYQSAFGGKAYCKLVYEDYQILEVTKFHSDPYCTK